MFDVSQLDTFTAVQSLRAMSLVDSRDLPDLATFLLVEGLDSPSLRDLAGLNLEPFDPRDAGALFDLVVGELGYRPILLADAYEWCLIVAAWAVVEGRVGPHDATVWFERLVASAGRPTGPPEAMQLAYGFEDVLDSGWRGHGTPHDDVVEAARGILARFDLMGWRPAATVERLLSPPDRWSTP